jgi:predicted nucleic acid-binding protein
MTGRVVIDASAAIAMLRGEPAAEAVERPLIRMLDRMVPGHFWLEVVNVLVRGLRLPPVEVIQALRELDELNLTTAPLDRPTLLLALDHAVRWGLTAYDAAYLALADATDAVLLTLDADLAAAAGRRAAPLGTATPRRRLSDVPVPYGEPIDWTRFGPYLARLRAEARGAEPRADPADRT